MAAETLDLRRYVGRWTLSAASQVGRVSLLVVDIVRSLSEVRVWFPRMMTEAWNIGVGSLFIVLLISGFAGAVTALQARYQFTGTIPIYYLAGVIVLEAWPVYTFLSARMQDGPAEVGLTPLLLGLSGAALLTAAAVVVPLRLGIAKVRSVDF